jgi:predicted AAA+ superfamily ATPase
MESYKKRFLDEKIAKKLKSSGGILLKGVRFCGKTTTAMRHAASSVRFDESTLIREQATLVPKIVLQGDTPRLIDEWQLVPSIWNAVRSEIDERSAKGQFILSGSASPSDDISTHTGAGRYHWGIYSRKYACIFLFDSFFLLPLYSKTIGNE